MSNALYGNDEIAIPLQHATRLHTRGVHRSFQPHGALPTIALGLALASSALVVLVTQFGGQNTVVAPSTDLAVLNGLGLPATAARPSVVSLRTHPLDQALDLPASEREPAAPARETEPAAFALENLPVLEADETSLGIDDALDAMAAPIAMPARPAALPEPNAGRRTRPPTPVN